MSKFQNYSIDDGHGNTLTAGLQPHLARKVAQHPAGPSDPMGQTVYCDGSCRS